MHAHRHRPKERTAAPPQAEEPAQGACLFVGLSSAGYLEGLRPAPISGGRVIDPLARETMPTAPGGRRSSGSSSHRLPRPPPVVVVPPPSPPAAPPTSTSSSLDPVDFDGKTWLYRDYVWLALALGLSPQGYLLGTLGLALGLMWELCLAAAFAAAVLSALLASATSHPSAKYGIPLCVALRSAFGPLGARLPGLLSVLLALPWCAWLLLLAAHALTAGIARFKPEAAAWAPISPSYLPKGHPSTLALLSLLAAALALWLWYVLGRQQQAQGQQGGGTGAGAGTPLGVRGFAPSAALALLGLFVGTAVWLGRTVGVGESLRAYDRLRSDSVALPLHISLPLATLAGVGCFASPLVLGYPDLARWCARRASPRHALLLAFPPAATAAAALGLLITGGLARGWSDPDSTPPGPLRFESPPYMAIVGGAILAAATLHTALAFYLVPAGYALLDVISTPPLRLRSALWAGSAFWLAALSLAVFVPQALLGRYDALSPSTLSFTTAPPPPPLSYHAWSLTAGLVGGAIAGVLLVDYYVVRQKRLPAAALYPTTTTSGSSSGVNPPALLALAAAFLPFAFHKAVQRALGDEWTGPELLPALSLLATFPCSFLAFLVASRCLALSPWGVPPAAARSSDEEELRRPVAVGANGRGVVSSSRQAGGAAGRSSSSSSRRRPPLGTAPVATSQQSASSQATEQLTATLHQLLMQHPPTPPPVPSAPPPPPSRGGEDELRPAPTVPPMAVGAAKPLGADEETKEQAGAIPHAYAVTVYTDDDDNDGGDAGRGRRRR